MAICNPEEKLLQEATSIIGCGRIYPVAKNICHLLRRLRRSVLLFVCCAAGVKYKISYVGLLSHRSCIIYDYIFVRIYVFVFYSVVIASDYSSLMRLQCTNKFTYLLSEIMTNQKTTGAIYSSNRTKRLNSNPQRLSRCPDFVLRGRLGICGQLSAAKAARAARNCSCVH